MRDAKLARLAGPCIVLVDGKIGSIDGSPDGLPRLWVVKLERELCLSGHHPYADTTPDHLSEQECAVGEDRVPGLGLGLEPIVRRQRPCGVGFRQVSKARCQRGHWPKVAVLDSCWARRRG